MIKIGTNFNYKAPYYLDGRQYAETPQGMAFYDVLHNWNIPIPDGFEVFCGGRWWTYGENNPVTVTGKFRPRAVGGGGEIGLTVNILHPTGTELYIPYNQTLSSVTVEWNTKYGSYSVKPEALTIQLNGTTYTPQNPSAIGRYEIDGVTIEGGNQLAVNGTFGGETVSSTATFVNTYTMYWGALPNASLSPSDLRKLFEVTEVTSATMQQTYDCTGGKYPYYVIPKSLYESVKNTLKMFVDGFENTAFSVTEMVANGETFSVIRHDYKQTGILPIEFIDS